MGIGPRGLRDISRDLSLYQNDFLDDATLKVVGRADLFLPGVVLSEPVVWKELDPSGGNVVRAGTRFIWPAYLSPRPPLGAIIVSDGIYYTAFKVEHKQHVECWEVDALNLNIVPASFNRCLLLKAVYDKASANEARATWLGYWSGQHPPLDEDSVRAHFQPFNETSMIQFGSEFSADSYKVTFERPVPPQLAAGEFRLVDSDGFRYRVIRYYEENRLDRLPIAVAQRILEGEEYHDPNPYPMTP